MTAKFESEKKQKELELLQSINDAQEAKIEEEKANIALKEENNRYLMIGLIFAGIAIVSVIFVLIRVRKAKAEIEKQKHIVDEKNREITDSISYAKRLQDAILPIQSALNMAIPNNFVLYLPKDIVAGDFYWLQEIDGIVLYAAADCTGHGVPGAMVSVVCHNALNRAVREYGLREPAKILDKTRDIVIETLKNSHQESISIKDGMDIALCSVNFNSGELQYAGANNSLYIINPSRSVAVENAKIFGEKGEGFEIKADKQPVSNHFNNEPFTNHIIKLEQGDCIYSFSDGYPDQFGGERGKKFMYKKFKYLLIDIYHKPISQQLLELENTFDNWKGSMEQVDDICIIGVKI